MSVAYLALGSNLGDRRANLLAAIDMLSRRGAAVLRQSDFFETDPVGGPGGQGRYLNAALEIATDLSPLELLQATQEVEAHLGRDRAAESRWGPRTCDVDILLFDQQVIQTQEVTIPHPRMHQRRFVLEPLAQISPDLLHPILKKTIRQLLEDWSIG